MTSLVGLNLDRRRVLQSTAALVATAAGTASFADRPADPASEAGVAAQRPQPRLSTQKLVGFMLAHQPFTV